jgi:antitoxin (DNA-binding transcriptional repressor) of toxin-antitoxin stability system
MTKYFGVREAKAHLSRLLTDVAAGEPSRIPSCGK